MHKVSICSLKGGVGKTSITLGLASAAVEAGIRTLIVDADPQGDATTGLDVPHTLDNLSLVLSTPKRKVIDRVLRPSGWTTDDPGTLDVIPGAPSVLEHDSPSLGPEHARRIARALSKIENNYDLCLIDCPPSLGGLTTMSLTASDRAAIVAEPGIFAVAAADRGLRAIDSLRRSYAPQLQPLGIIINRFRPRSSEHAFRTQELTNLFGPLILSPTLPDRAALQQAQGAAQPIHAWPTPQARELAEMFDQLLHRVLRSASLPPSTGQIRRTRRSAKSAT